MSTNKLTPNIRYSRALPKASRSGVALLVTLLALALMTIIAVAFLGTMNWEVQSSRRTFEGQKARGLATLGLHTAVSQLRNALLTWDSPYGNDGTGNIVGGAVNGTAGGNGFLATTTPTNYWSVSPGILTRWIYSSSTPVTNFPLFSLPAVTFQTANNLANLNAQAEDGTYPILGSSTPLNVYWVNVGTNVTTATGSANPIIGRYAFWTDDENSKININTADGVLNTNFPSTYMGAGTPTEVSLMELKAADGTTQLANADAASIVTFARKYGFSSTREMLRAATSSPATALNIYTNNLFNLTMFSRSPDINIFGQPKIALIPANEVAAPYSSTASSLMWNLMTLQPLKEIFPSLSGFGEVGSSSIAAILPSLSLVNNFYPIASPSVATFNSQKWPVVFHAEEADGSAGFQTAPGTGGFSPWNNGMVIARYLSGTNASGKPIAWPAFPGAASLTLGGYIGTTGSNGKYTARQADSIAVQIVDLAEKDSAQDISAPQAWVSPGSAGYLIPGWLSGKLVSGVGRSPKADKVMMQYQARYNTSIAGPGNTTNYYPTINTKIFVEEYFPSRFSGISMYHESIVNGGLSLGNFGEGPYINENDRAAYFSLTNSSSLGPGSTPLSQNQAGLLPKLPPNVSTFTTGNGGATIGTPAVVGNFGYWSNNVLQNDCGIDWNGNPGNLPDPDQNLAALYHSYALQTNNSPAVTGQYGPNTSFSQAVATNFVMSGIYAGTGQQTYPPLSVFQMNNWVKVGRNPASTDIMDDWAPGEYRVVSNKALDVDFAMSTNAAFAGFAHIYGGVSLRMQISGSRGCDPDPVPLDAIHGNVWPTTSLTLPGMGTATANAIVGNPGVGAPFSMTGETVFTGNNKLYTNILNAVIPMPATVAVPSSYVKGSGYATPTTIYAMVNQGDILVNKFPGDWTITTNTPPANWQMVLSDDPATVSADGSNAKVTLESSLTAKQMTDPDAFWLPTIDNLAAWNNVYLGHPVDNPQMPRTARFPSIGYLNYIRTGIIPDDETVNYTQQHGTPFRLLNFSPSTDGSQKVHSVAYPDWAMLDLFYIPSSLLGYGSPYETFAGPTVTPTSYTTATGTNNPVSIVYANTNVVNNMYLYGTYGGATSGRINPNGSVIYTTNVNLPTPGLTRTVPLQALLHGLSYNQSQPTTGGTVVTTYGTADSLGTNDFHYPLLTAGTAVDPVAVANDIAKYLTTNTYGVGGTTPAPLRMPEEICNIPSVAAAVPSVNATRNDLVRQIVGNLTTQSNTFSIWVEAQSITKSKSSANPGSYDSAAGDQITGSVRYHYIVERDLDPGGDGVYGNAAGAGLDGIVGTLDDLAGTSNPSTNPLAPNYTYRILYSEEIR